MNDEIIFMMEGEPGHWSPIDILELSHELYRKSDRATPFIKSLLGGGIIKVNGYNVIAVSSKKGANIDVKV